MSFEIRQKIQQGERYYELDSYPEQKEKTIIQVSHEHGYADMQFRKCYVTESGGRGNKITAAYRWHFDAIEAVQFGTLLIDIAEKNLVANNENPNIKVIADADKVVFDANNPSWLIEDLKTAETRIRNRKNRSYMVKLFQRLVSLSEDEDRILAMCNILSDWAKREGGDFEQFQAEKMIEQLGYIKKADIEELFMGENDDI